MLGAEDNVGRARAIGELLDRLVRSTGHLPDRLGPLTAVLLLLWRGSHNPDEVGQARSQAVAVLKAAELDVRELTRLATTGRTLLDVALRLQGEALLAAPESAEYVPQEGDLAIWLDKHVVKIAAVDAAEIRDGSGPLKTIRSVWVLTAGGQRLPVSPGELELYHREGEQDAV